MSWVEWVLTASALGLLSLVAVIVYSELMDTRQAKYTAVWRAKP